MIMMLQDDDDRWIEDKEQIKGLVNAYYMKLLSIGSQWQDWERRLFHPQI